MVTLAAPAAIASGASAASGAGFSLGSLGSILGGIGSVGGLFGKKKKGPDADDLMAMQEKYRIAAFRKNMDLAKEYGIHPLTMLGVPTSSGASVSAPFQDEESFGEKLGRAGQDIGRALNSGLTNMERLQERLLTAQIEGQEIDNISRASMIARHNQPGNPPNASDLNERLVGSGQTLASRLMSVPAKALGSADGYYPLHTTAYDEEGNPIRVYNSNDLGDNEGAQIAHFFGYTLPDIIGARTGRGAITKFLARILKSPGNEYSKFRK